MNKKVKQKLRKGDMVRILTGKDRGKTGKIMAVLAADNRVLVEAVNMVKKHVRPKRAGEKGQRVSVAAPIDVSNVQIVCPACKKSTRVVIVREGDEKRRTCRHCKGSID
ncbi:MAG: 50S ribosomal protein L24 [Candidatus Andersenbacteria bacterium RIFCSPHIGHO2_12_FULL_46_9]|nr:MAG: 50S ribosomal protein L24 [Candidatus Andersenbacteria bacterium RIFCSPHIGHO2_02_FULL_46_16]OGY36835.1 MAG: 50S ribosomal protein L24 [Candidatus Andersenbacteria bacterium RIFCSPLOWO2_02_FULL_46_11]OGY38469.1 MAG: 50S ribosomal protein L24 [Candidatus Andersenbacteria bacterium RIFCSPHIGHO2_12_FULL_46_9]OGY41634.1 MAG: 50S ribosomal protein L24 [Candidatus Andersenbacteria bacterium RIFCSPLOWO2_12_FULL_45_8]HBE90207.1 50S ribosomal protein L24 [Candidatus Andersenbacteria bacterium]